MSIWNKLSDNADENEMCAVLFSESARDKLKMFCEIYIPDYADTIDWNKGYKILEDEIKPLLTEKYLRKDALTLLISATQHSGAPRRFLIHMIFKMQVELIKVGAMDVPEEARQLADPSTMKMKEIYGLGEYGQTAMMMFRMMKTARQKKGTIKPLDNTPNCTICGRSDLPLTITINATTMEAGKVCSVCMSKQGSSPNPKKKVDIKKLDKEIEKLEKLAKDYEQLIMDQPTASDVSPELAPYAMTPMSSYKSVQALLADARAERLAALTAMNSEVRLKYEMNKAVAEEDYEKSAKLRDKLKKIMK
jgi:transcription elongation factor Elf1